MVFSAAVLPPILPITADPKRSIALNNLAQETAYFSSDSFSRSKKSFAVAASMREAIS